MSRRLFLVNSSESPKPKHFLHALSSGPRPLRRGGMTAGPSRRTDKRGPMDFLVRLSAMLALSVATVAAIPVAADYEGPDGYGATTAYELDVSHDGYGREGHESETADPTTYVIIEAESGTTEQVDGETVIVVQEPEPTAATEAAPPPPRTVVVEQPVSPCSEGIWVDGYWSYADGEYLWVDGHCVVERVNYVFVHPRWDYYSNVWWFVPGYYRPWGVYVGFGYYRPWHWYPPYHHPYYHRGHPAPVRRGVPHRPTTVRGTTVRRTPSHGVLSRPGYAPGRTSTVERRPPRTSTVARSPTIRRSASVTRAPAVTRMPTRARTVTRPPSRTSTVARAPTVTRSPSSSRPTTGPSRTSGARRPSASPSRGGSSGRSNASPSRARSFGRPSFGASRSSVGRGGGFSRPSSGGFGGSRSVSPARGR